MQQKRREMWDEKDQMKDTIIHLPGEQWKGTVVPIGYTTETYYDVNMHKVSDGYDITIHKRKFDVPVTHCPEVYDFPDKLYREHWEKAFAWGSSKRRMVNRI